MTLRVVGAGLGRTGTTSLKLALERLLDGPCYHMSEVFQHPDHIGLWHGAAHGDMPAWKTLFQGYVAAVDWPVASFWAELSAAFPQALVVLSVRDPDTWWQSASSTIFPAVEGIDNDAWRAMSKDVFDARFTIALDDRAGCVAAYERHMAEVRSTAPAGRLLEWRPEDGWGPLCAALGLPVPDEPFPRANTRKEFLAHTR